MWLCAYECRCPWDPEMGAGYPVVTNSWKPIPVNTGNKSKSSSRAEIILITDQSLQSPNWGLLHTHSHFCDKIWDNRNDCFYVFVVYRVRQIFIHRIFFEIIGVIVFMSLWFIEFAIFSYTDFLFPEWLLRKNLSFIRMRKLSYSDNFFWLI